MMRLGAVCSVLAVLVACAPAVAVAAPTAEARTPSVRSLADRIQDAIDRYQSAGTRPSLDELTALTAEAGKDPALDPGLRADLATIYAYTLARNKQGDKAVEVIVAAQAAYGTPDRKMGDLLLAEAVFEDFTGHGDQALATKRKALALYTAVLGPDDVLVATTQVQIAFSLFARGQLADALDLYGKGLPVMAGDDSVVRVYATQMANYANALRLSGDLDGSLAAGRAALDVARARLPAGHTALLYGLDNTGATLMDMGRYGEAEAVLREAVDAAHSALGSASVDTAGFTYHLAQVLALEGHDAEARSLLQSALADLEGVNTGANPDLPGLIHLEMSRLARDGGDLKAARAELEAGLAAISASGQTGAMTRARLQTRLAEVLLVEGQAAAAAGQVAAALPYYRDNLPASAPDRVNAEMLDALIRSRLGDTAAAYDAATAVAATLTARLDGAKAIGGVTRDEQAETSRAYTQALALYADIALSAGHADAAFDAAQRAALTEVAATSQGLAARAAADNPLARDLARSLQDAQALRGRLDRQRTYALARSVTEVARLDGQIADVDGTLNTLSAQLDDVFPAFASLSHPRPVGIDAARATLDGRRAILMPVAAADRLITLVVTRTGLTWDSAPLARGQVDSDVRRLRASVAAGLLDPAAGFDRAPAWELGQALFTPRVRAALSGRDTIEVLGAGPLMTVPFSLLLTEAPRGADNDPRSLRDSAWLVRRFAVSVRPALVTAPRAVAPVSGFLGVGAPVLGPDAEGFLGDAPVFRGDKDTVADVEALRHLPSLPGAKDELVRMLGALSLPHSDLVTGADATETKLKSMPLDNYSVIAFATHGLVSGNLRTMREPALVLTPPAEPSDSDDGLLTASDVAGLKLNARWVILSACNTGAGREDGAAGYSGLARAFMQAGAHSLMVSLWPVRDDVADRLAVGTVERNARGDSQPQALRKAVLDLLKDPSVRGGANPAIWAPFSLVVQ